MNKLIKYIIAVLMIGPVFLTLILAAWLSVIPVAVLGILSGIACLACDPDTSERVEDWIFRYMPISLVFDLFDRIGSWWKTVEIIK